jgi:hypothetical protein
MLPTVQLEDVVQEVAGSSTSRRLPQARSSSTPPAASLAPQRASDGPTPPAGRTTPGRSFSVASAFRPHRPRGQRMQIRVSMTLDRLAPSLG